MKLNQHQPISLSGSARARVLTATRSNFFPHHAWLISLKITLILVITILIGWGLRQALVKTAATQQQRHLQPLVSKSHYQATEAIEFRLDISTSNLERVLNQLRPPQAKAAEPTVSAENTYQSGDTVVNTYLTDPSGNLVNTPVQITPLSPTTYKLKVSADSKFQPGSKTLIAEVIREGETTTYKQDFTWGVLALNTNKANYQPGETVKISLAVLNRTGHMVCDAQLNLTITKPDGSTRRLSTQDQSIQLNQQECQTYAVTDKPDYETTFKVDQIGDYQLRLAATTNEGQFELSEQISVAAQADFVIERLGATRIYPYATQYTNLILITPIQDFSGTVTETLPAGFKVVDRSSPETCQVSSSDHESLLSWQVNWRAGETHAMHYTYESPGVSPMFYLLGPVTIRASNAGIPNLTDRPDSTVFTDYAIPTDPTDLPGSTIFTDGRAWQIASDATTVSDSFTESSNTVLTSHTPDTGTGWSKVYDSYGTSESYVLASTGVAKAAASVTSVGQAFTAAPSASGTDQDISITIKNKPTTTGTRPAGIFGRYTDNSNFYHVQLLQNESSADSVSLIKFVGGTATVLGSSDETLAINDVIKLEIRDATKKVYINSNLILSSSDNAITSGAGWGLYFGNFNGAGGGTYHMRAEWEFDDFLAEEPGGSNSAPTAPTSLLAEGASNPTGVTDPTPELSAIYNDPDTSDTANYYQIQVNTASNFGGTSMWDSGKTSMSSLNQGNRSSDVSYNGSALSGSTTYYWRIKFWDTTGAEGTWSSAANFTMAAVNSAPTAPTSLLAEGASNPTGVTDTTPELSAIYNDPDTSDTANYYQIQVNTASNFGGTSMWDSGKTSMSSLNQGNRSSDISYNGSALSGSTTYYWRIKFWDTTGAEGTWSSAANFTMAAASAETNIYLEGINAEGIKID